MHLWIDARMFSCSGIGTVIKNLLPQLTKDPFTTGLIVSQSDFIKKSQLQKTTCRPSHAPIYSLQEQIMLATHVPKCDLFWSPHFNIPILPIRAKKRVVTIHDAFHLAFTRTLGWKEKTYAKFMLRQAVSRSDAILTVSQFSKKELCRYLSLSEDRIQVIYPGVDFLRFSKKHPPQTILALKKKYALPDLFFLFVGNVKPHKNLKLILDAYEQFAIDLPLVIVGKNQGLRQTDPSIERIEQTPHLKKNMHLVGEIEDVELAAFYQMAIALLFPSLYEGFGLPPLEAMAAGCPTIVSHLASLPEVCGQAAHFIYENNPDELAEGMRKVANDALYRNLLQEKGRIQAKLFSWETTAEKYCRLFQEIAFG